MDSLAFLDNPSKTALAPVYVLHGDEHFLKRRVLAALRQRAFGADGDDFGFSRHPGEKAELATVLDELRTAPFLGSWRLVHVEDADPFVTRYRAGLEKYLAAPASTGTLVLEVRTWTSTTRLAKLLKPSETITCKAPPAYKLPDWCARWAATVHEKQLSAPAARLLVDLVGTDMGQLDQEIGKLAVYAGNSKRIDVNDVDRLIGHSREESIFKAFDALAARQPAAALDVLEHAFTQGEEPIRILGAFSMQLRRLARAATLVKQGRPPVQAVEEAGFLPFARQSALKHLQALGPGGTEHFYDWLVETDLGLKGASPLPPRTQLERLLVRVMRAGKPS